jgi:hypothetical protein
MIAPLMWDNAHIFIDPDFLEYLEEQGGAEGREVWGFLEEYLKEECE